MNWKGSILTVSVAPPLIISENLNLNFWILTLEYTCREAWSIRQPGGVACLRPSERGMSSVPGQPGPAWRHCASEEVAHNAPINGVLLLFYAIEHRMMPRPACVYMCQVPPHATRTSSARASEWQTARVGLNSARRKPGAGASPDDD